MTAVAIVNDRAVLSSERMLHKDCERKFAVAYNLVGSVVLFSSVFAIF
jgi:hypothetical protein